MTVVTHRQARLDRIVKQAKQEIEDEDFLEQVKLEKIRLREHVPFWNRIFPWTITVSRRVK